jgi:hypothetical protein
MGEKIGITAPGVTGSDAWTKAVRYLPHSAEDFFRLAGEYLGEAPPVPVQAHLLSLAPDEVVLKVLGRLYEICDDTQRRGLLRSLEMPVAPGFLAVFEALAVQGSPQTAEAAVRALGRLRLPESLSVLGALRDKAPGLNAIIDVAEVELRGRLAKRDGASPGDLALVPREAGGLALSGTKQRASRRVGEPRKRATAPMRLNLGPLADFDLLPPPPRRVPVHVRLAYWTLADNRWGPFWSLSMALGVMGALRDRDHAWIIPLTIGVVGLIINHFVSHTGTQLKLLKHGRTARARVKRGWTVSERRSRGQTAHTYHYESVFVAENGQSYTAQGAYSKPRPELVDEAEEGIIYLPTADGGADARRSIDALRVVRVDGEGRIRLRLGWLLRLLLALAPWFLVLSERLEG